MTDLDDEVLDAIYDICGDPRAWPPLQLDKQGRTHVMTMIDEIKRRRDEPPVTPAMVRRLLAAVAKGDRAGWTTSIAATLEAWAVRENSRRS